jgi:hypothetical protein
MANGWDWSWNELPRFPHMSHFIYLLRPLKPDKRRKQEVARVDIAGCNETVGPVDHFKPAHFKPASLQTMNSGSIN